MIKRVYALGYFPFSMGGSVWQPIACRVQARGPFPIGHGFRAYLVTSPAGVTHVAEAKSGAFVGSTLEQVRRDVSSGSYLVMIKQVAGAVAQSKTARELSPEEFWGTFRSEKREGEK